ncbi:MAG: nitroreductase [Pseudomonadota bacterium]
MADISFPQTDPENTANTGPLFGEPLAPCHPNEAAVTALATRRSTQADLLTGPGPTIDELDTLLKIAARVPDHRRVCPYRFITFAGEARARAGAILAEVYGTHHPEADDAQRAKERGRFERAPIIVAVVSAVDENHRTPVWEQVLTAGAVCQNLLLAASASGFAGQWLTEWYAYDQEVLSRFGVQAGEKIAGFVYLGTAREWPKERKRADHRALVTAFV